MKNADSKTVGGNFGLSPRRSGCLSGEYSGVAKREGGGWNGLDPCEY